ncbi:unnamed protein product, partial [marine sediment metagenome]
IGLAAISSTVLVNFGAKVGLVMKKRLWQAPL